LIDASVAIKWFLPDAADEANALQALELFLRLRTAEVSLLQPAHWKAEVASVLARRAPTTAAADLDDLNLLEGIQIIDTPMIYRRAVELAVGLSHHLFDTLYRKRSAHPPLGAQDHSGFLSGSNSSMRLFGQAGSFSRVSVSQAIGSMPFMRAVSSSD
jgi:predicted nucleic acid-binding protein